MGQSVSGKKDDSPTRNTDGIRTFTVAALMGAVGLMLGGIELLALLVLVVRAGTH